MGSVTMSVGHKALCVSARPSDRGPTQQVNSAQVAGMEWFYTSRSGGIDLNRSIKDQAAAGEINKISFPFLSQSGPQLGHSKQQMLPQLPQGQDWAMRVICGAIN